MDRRRPAFRSLIVVAIIGVFLIATLPAAAAPSEGSLLSTVPGPADPEAILITVTVGTDGTAHWQVRYTFTLDDENATTAFESLQTDIEADPETFRDRFADRMQETAATAEAATGRDMAVENVTVDASIDPFSGDQGFITYRFAWTGFAAQENAQLVVGDAIDGLFLTPNATLTVGWSLGYIASEVHPTADERRPRAATWTGERNFGPGEPRVVLAPAGDGATGGETGASAVPSGTDTTPGWPSPVLLAAVAAGAVAVIGVAWRWRARVKTILPPAITGSDQSATPDPGDELLSNEERVLAILERHGGRAKQQDIVAATGWSEVKTSEVVQALREQGTIEAFRLGRENVLSLPDNSNT